MFSFVLLSYGIVWNIIDIHYCTKNKIFMKKTKNNMMISSICLTDPMCLCAVQAICKLEINYLTNLEDAMCVSYEVMSAWIHFGPINSPWWICKGLSPRNLSFVIIRDSENTKASTHLFRKPIKWLIITLCMMCFVYIYVQLNKLCMKFVWIKKCPKEVFCIPLPEWAAAFVLSWPQHS